MKFIEKVEILLGILMPDDYKNEWRYASNDAVRATFEVDEAEAEAIRTAAFSVMKYYFASDNKAELLQTEVQEILNIIERKRKAEVKAMAKIKKTSFSIFDLINDAAKKLDHSKLNKITISELEVNFQSVAAYLGCNNTQAMLFILIFYINCNEEHYGVNFRELQRFLRTEFIELLVFQKDIDVLLELRLLHKEYMHCNSKFKILKFKYSIPVELTDAIFSNESLPEIEIEAAWDSYQFVAEVSKLIDKRSSEEFNSRELAEMVESLEEQHNQVNVVAQVQTLNINQADRILFYEMCNDLVVNSGRTGVDITLSDIYSSVSLRLKKTREITSQKNRLFELDLIEIEAGNFASDMILNLTAKGKDLFLGEDVDLFLKKDKANNLINPDKIVSKSLFFDAELDNQVQFLQQSLEQTSFTNLQKRLEEKSLSKGVAAIFYGTPGTGKTETVYQLAKQSGRSILHVDISQSKSMWFGESEKKIKEIFTNYRKLCNNQPLKPILLFNEADAIFGKRKEGTDSNVAQTENAMQNILLEEMEKLDGILIATTNLTQNLDDAFERRFLFKVEFKKPTTEAKQKIWQNKLPWLEDADAKTLAAKFSFSGGEIDNIVRKVTMEEVLSGTVPDTLQITALCNSEKFTKKGGNRIGF